MATTTTTPAVTSDSEPNKSGKKRKKWVMFAGALLVGATAAYWFLLRPAPEPKEPEEGEISALEAVQVNLARGHYLRIGIALQLSADVAEEVDGSKALDAMIDIYTGEDIQDLSEVERREELRASLAERVAELYEDEVLDVYITEFVTQ